MTKLEFNQFIESFHKEKGNYTEEELYQIGVAHKTLPLGERDWAELTERLGVEKRSDTYRTWVAHRQQRDGTLPKDPTKLSGRTLNELSGGDITENLNEQITTLYKEKQKVRDTYNAYRRNLRDESRIEDFKDLIKEAVATLKPFDTTPCIYPTTNAEKEAILMLSDLHIGVDCDNFYNTYNVAIAKERLDILAESTIHYCRANDVATLNVVNLGDMVHGLIHTSARLEQEMDTVEQVIQASELLANFLNKLANNVPHIVYRSCTDNHSRVVANKNEHIEKDNFYRIIDWYLQSRVGGSITMVNDNIDESIGKFELKNGKKVMFAHGHNDGINLVFQHFVGATHEFIDYMLLGHYHSEKAKSFQGSKVFVNGSIVGTEQYALSKRLFSKPAQTLLIFDKENILNISIDLSTN